MAQRFPLIARPRPACLPLPQRVQSLAELADTAADRDDPSLASTVYNQAALLASDIGIPDMARELCLRHAAAYLHAAPLPSRAAIRALEPVVNLARLQIRAGQAANGRQRLLALFEDICVPADLTASAEDRREVRTWLWRVLLVDGARALTTAGRWAEALVHIEAQHGVGQRMLDGRQVAVLTALTAGDALSAERLLAHTVPGEPWENAVAGCLTVLCRRTAGRTWQGHLKKLVATYLARSDERNMAVFNTRLGLTVLDALDSVHDPAARLVVAELHRRTTETHDGYAARETLAHPSFATLITEQGQQDCRALLRACALGAGKLPHELSDQLAAALRTSDQTIRKNPRQESTVESG